MQHSQVRATVKVYCGMDEQNYRNLLEQLRAAEMALDAAAVTLDACETCRALDNALTHLRPVAVGLGLDLPEATRLEYEDQEAFEHALWSLRTLAREELRRQRPAGAIQRLRRFRLRLAVALGCLGLLTLLAMESAAWMLPDGLLVTYYRTRQLQRPQWRTVERRLKKDYTNVLSGGWGVRTDFSARWEGWLMVPRDDEYYFAAQNRDGLRLFLDEEQLIDNWKDQRWWKASERRAKTWLKKGPHRIRIEHYVADGPGALEVRWTGGGIPPHTILAAPHLRKRI